MKGKEAKENQGDDRRQVFLILSFDYGHRIDADHIHTMQFTTIISVDVPKCNAIWRLQPCRPQNAMQFGDCSRAGLKMQCNLATAAVQASKCNAIWRPQPCRCLMHDVLRRSAAQKVPYDAIVNAMLRRHSAKDDACNPMRQNLFS